MSDVEAKMKKGAGKARGRLRDRIEEMLRSAESEHYVANHADMGLLSDLDRLLNESLRGSRAEVLDVIRHLLRQESLPEPAAASLILVAAARSLRELRPAVEEVGRRRNGAVRQAANQFALLDDQI